jgi:RES domain-containing protein
VRLWRLTRRPFADLSGEGARLFGGRWTSPGRPVVYASEEAALTALEVRVHLDLPFDMLPDDYVLLGIDLPDDVAVEDVARLADEPRRMGDAWLAEALTALLRVRSAIVPESRNMLLNPLHADAGRAVIAYSRPWRFDPRLFRP